MKAKPKANAADRLAYMIAWRDRYIERLKEQLQGREEESAMQSALLFYALFEKARGDEVREVTIGREALSELLSVWSCSVAPTEEGYLVRFRKKSEESADGGEETDK